jgi:hypothetical protein
MTEPFDASRLEPLIALLFDTSARWDERDDAAIDLHASDDNRAVEALLAFASDPANDEELGGTCGESLAEIAIRRGLSVRSWLERLQPLARHEVEAWVRADRPELM